MKKRIVSLALVVALIAVAVAGATMAYFTDTKQAVNVATVGNVKIQQLELQRAEGVPHVGTAQKGDLVPYVQGQKLSPAYPAAGDASYTAERTDLFYWGHYAPGGNGLWPDTLNGAMDKFVFVENTGASDAYYRTWIALECPEGMEYSLGSDKDFMMNVNGNARFTWTEEGYAVIDGTRYRIVLATYNEILAPGEVSRPSLLQVVMTHHVTNEKAALLGSTYEILVFSQAVQADNFPDAATALKEAFGEENPWGADFELPTMVSTAEELDAALSAAAAAKAGDTEIMLLGDLDLTGYDWTPINVNGYNGAGVITLNGNGHTITGLNAPLFEGGFAGKSGIVINDLTIADSVIETDSTLGGGAFIANADSMHVITLNNCHLINSKVLAPEARTGGLIGWCSGYAKLDDGPVKAYITIKDCSVINCELTGTSIGGIAGHPGASDYTYTTIDNCVVLNTVMTSTDDGGWRVGDIVGTANNGHVVINNAITGGNTKTMPNSTDTIANAYHELVGRFVPAGTGTLEINGSVLGVTNEEDLKDAASSGEDFTLMDDVEMEADTTAPYGNKTGLIHNGGVFDGNGNTLTIECYGDDYGIMTSGGTIQNLNVTGVFRGIVTMNLKEDLILKNVSVKGEGIGYGLNTAEGNGQYKIIAVDCAFEGWNSYGNTVASVSFTNCTFSEGSYFGHSDADRLVKPYVDAEFIGCSFSENYYLDLSALAQGCTVVLDNCTVNGVLVTAANIESVFGFVELPGYAGGDVSVCVIVK